METTLARTGRSATAVQSFVRSDEDGIEIPIHGEHDVMDASRRARQLAERLGFGRAAAYHIATSASELASNLLIHAGGGLLRARALLAPQGLELIAEDRGPGIPDLELALREGYSTAGGLGCGLPGVRRLMDEFSIESRPGRGTRVQAIKWR